MSKCNPILRYQNNPNSRMRAIHVRCSECVGCTSNHLEKGFKESISACSSHSSPMHGFRPYQLEKSLNRKKTPVPNLSKYSLCHESS